MMQNLKYIIYDETHRDKLRSKFHREPIFLTYPWWADPHHRPVEIYCSPQIHVFFPGNTFPPCIAIQWAFWSPGFLIAFPN